MLAAVFSFGRLRGSGVCGVGAGLRVLQKRFAEIVPERLERNRNHTRETLPALNARRGRVAAEQGHKRSYWIAVWRLLLLHCSFSWCWRSGSPCSCCSRCSCLSCRACSSRFERASRSTIARFSLGVKIATRAPQEAPRRLPRRPKIHPKSILMLKTSKIKKSLKNQ